MSLYLVAEKISEKNEEMKFLNFYLQSRMIKYIIIPLIKQKLNNYVINGDEQTSIFLGYVMNKSFRAWVLKNYTPKN